MKLGTMRCRSATKVVPLHHTLKPLALRDSHDIYSFHVLEEASMKFLTCRKLLGYLR
jgi:hypothetical protein